MDDELPFESDQGGLPWPNDPYDRQVGFTNPSRPLYAPQQPNYVCDFPNCANPISARCNLCGRAMCVRHIEWIGIQGTDDNYVPGHYCCDICSYQIGQANAARAGRGTPYIIAGL